MSNLTYVVNEGVELHVNVPLPGPYFICYRPDGLPMRTLAPFFVYEREFRIDVFFEWSAPFLAGVVLCCALWVWFHGRVIGGYSLVDATIYGMKLGNRNCLLVVPACPPCACDALVQPAGVPGAGVLALR